ncbi:Uma2 family endonuclease [Nonomuraea typhae]|uniref:Uma2 family endonuclease n=1 Tax=Nonomuraea typhae TaxID=2603600 RepID=A0ABW7YN50_9ACTN
MVATEHRPRVKPYTAPEDQLPTTVRELFDALPPLPGLRVEVIEGKVLVSPVGKPPHQAIAYELGVLLAPVIRKEKWQGYGGVNISIEGPRDILVPDFAIAPKNCALWGDSELRSSGVIMVVEVVSPGSVREDRKVKPRLYATGGIPIFLVIDPLERSTTLYSTILDNAYQVVNRQPLGQVIHLPAPVDFDLDTALLME